MIKYNYYPENNFILTVVYGKTNPEELHNLVDKLLTIKHNTGGMRGLTILSKNSTFKDIRASDIMGAGDKMRQAKFRKDGKNAIIAETLLSYGLSRMYKVATDIMNLDELNIYKENRLDDAIEWLELGILRDQIIEVIERCRYSESNP
ncbi:MAG: hypothetical protein KAT06_09730 [Gammaproteobacteria bacterium]|nr:hypothetical protein [Gammaproteobacteria bacterium]